MIVHFEGEDLKFDLEDLDLTQARYLKRTFNISLQKLRDGLEELDPDCMAALYWLMKAQNGKIVDPNKVNFKVFDFLMALGAALEEEKENPTGEASDETPENPANQ